jgi:ankyrin repeat protein
MQSHFRILAAAIVASVGFCLFAEEKPAEEKEQQAVRLLQAARTGDLSEVKRLIESGIDIEAGSPDHTPLATAVSEQRENVVEFLLKKGANTKPAPGGHSLLTFAAVVGNERMTSLLIEGGIDPNSRGKHGITPIHLAKTKRVASVLLDNGADINAVSELGRTPLHYAAMNGDKELIEFLFKHGAKLSIKDKDGKTPLDLSKNEVVTKWITDLQELK